LLRIRWFNPLVFYWVLPPIAFGESGLKERIKNVMDFIKRSNAVVFISVALVTALTAGFAVNRISADYPAHVVGEYDASLLGGSFAKSDNPAYKIGANAYGMPVFADLDIALYAIKEDCASGFEHLSQEFDLPPVSKRYYSSYMVYGWQTTANDEALRKQCVEISQFFDVYENAFSTHRPASHAPTAHEAPAQTTLTELLP
jgi:hypothetical protein